MRTEFVNIAAGFALLPTLAGNASKAVIINSGASGLTTTTGTLALGGNFSSQGAVSLAGAFATTGAFNLTLALSASVTLTMPQVNGTLATLAGTETLFNKTLFQPALGTPLSGVLTNCTGTASGLTAGNATAAVTATNQSGGSVNATTIVSSGDASVAGDFGAGLGVLTVTKFSSTVDINGALQVTGQSSFDNNLTIGGALFAAQFAVSVGTTLTVTGTTVSGGFKSTTLAASTSYANDAAAAAGGVAIGSFYRNGSVVMIRVA